MRFRFLTFAALFTLMLCGSTVLAADYQFSSSTILWTNTASQTYTINRCH